MHRFTFHVDGTLRTLASATAALALLWPPAAAHAGEMTAGQFARAWAAARPLTDVPAVSNLAEAEVFQGAFVEHLTALLGRPVGYKAALTSRTVQERFGIDHPLLGVLLDRMIQPDGTEFPRDFAARPVAEGDLLMRVRDDSINGATTDLDLLGALDAVIPFIELADLVLATNVTPTAELLTVINAGARAGVRGAPVSMENSEEQLYRLANASVTLRDESGAVVASGGASAILGHPINAVRWIRDEVLRRGDKLRGGDLLSLGSLTPLVPVGDHTRITADYQGLRDDIPVVITVSFRPANP